MSRSFVKYGIVFLCLSIIDRVTKMAASCWCVSEKVVTSYFSCETVINRGLALSIGHGETPGLFYVSLFAAITVTVLCCLYAQTLWRSHVSLWGIGAVIVGALCNITDRLLYGGVIDFIVMHYHEWAFPTFNIADLMICSGVALVMLQQQRDV